MQDDLSSVLISVQELNSLIESNPENVVILDTRDNFDYLENHIPGSINNHSIFTYVTSELTGGLEGLQKDFADYFGKCGISNKSHVIIYEDAHNTGYGQSEGLLLILKYLGHLKVSILNGGYKAWLGARLPVTKEVPSLTPVNFKVRIDRSWIVTTAQMLAAVNNPNQAVILDCRDKIEWVGLSSSPYGIDYCPRKGRIPGAVWIEWYDLMKNSLPDPMFISVEDIQKKCQEVGITSNTPVYVYCFKGSRAANTLLALKLAGVKNVKNYFESWNVWSRDFSLPIDDQVIDDGKKIGW